MPVGIQRINARHAQPNPHIVFIKPLKGPDEHVARQFLERIAAQCVPIMRRHHISVMTLEEYEPNAAFVGRNFNAGEVIQLVLKSRGSRQARPQWLPFGYVQMVMMHELAHCKQMNHARAFWVVRNAYAAEMRQLWADRYTGEGVWGRGAVLGASAGGTPVYERDAVAMDDQEALLMDHLCGGTFRSRGRKRGTKGKAEQLTYREREDRRVKRKFGVNGVALGDDLEERARLEAAAPAKKQKQATPAKMTKAEQKRLATKPRVAGSKRGRELRAAAALARFGQAAKKEEEEEDIKLEEEEEDDDEEYDDDEPVAGPDAVDIDGSRLLDGQGRAMVRVCEDAEDDGGGGGGATSGSDGADDARRELLELVQSAGWGVKDEPVERRVKDEPAVKRRVKDEPVVKTERARDERPAVSLADIPAAVKRAVKSDRPGVSLSDIPAAVKTNRPAVSLGDIPSAVKTKRPAASLSDTPTAVKTDRPATSLSDIPRTTSPPATTPTSTACGVCSYANTEHALTCAICGHVLHADAVAGAWHCSSTACQPVPGTTVRYLNAGDCGVCGACGQRRAA